MKDKRILITGGAGDLGRRLTPLLIELGAAVTSLDLIDTKVEGARSVSGSILDRDLVEYEAAASDLINHIAAWHGYHEFAAIRSDYEFWDLNMTGTFNLLKAAAYSGEKRFLFVSSTSVDEWPGLYGMTKLLGEELCRAFSTRHAMKVLALRPRAFIPWENTAVYKSYQEWAEWFAKGAVHINDVAQSMVLASTYLFQLKEPFFDSVEIDGKHDFPAEDLRQWSERGWEFITSTRLARFAADLSEIGFRCETPPRYKNAHKASSLLGYEAKFGFMEMVEELVQRKHRA